MQCNARYSGYPKGRTLMPNPNKHLLEKNYIVEEEGGEGIKKKIEEEEEK